MRSILVYLLDTLFIYILATLSVQIKSGEVITSPGVTINDSFYIREDSYTDNYLEIYYTNLISPTMLVAIPIVIEFAEKLGVSTYDDKKTLFTRFVRFDDQNQDRINIEHKISQDKYNFAYLYFFLSANIVVSYLFLRVLLLKFFHNNKNALVWFYIVVVVSIVFFYPIYDVIDPNVRSISVLELLRMI